MTARTRPTTSASGYDLRPLSDEERVAHAERLDPEERRVLLARGTERPFCGGLLKNEADGAYACRLCGLPLFGSDAKFESGTGWPSFHSPYDKAHVAEILDESHGMVRT